jgi:hypothetical protein
MTKAKYAPLTPEQDAFLGSATAEFNRKIETLKKDWNFDNYDEWGFDQVSGTFFLKLEDGSRVEADGQIIGSHFPAKQSWEWAWNNPHVVSAMKHDSTKVREFGEKQKLEYLTAGMVPTPDAAFATYLASIAVKVAGAEGAFAGPAGPINVYIALKNLRRKKA